MILLMCGSHGTGKSTTVLELAKNHPEYIVSDSVSEKFFKREDFKKLETMVEKQRAFTNFQLDVFTGRLYGHNTLSSRSFADIWAYTKHLYDKSNDAEYLDQLRDIEQQALAASYAYGKDLQIAYFPIMFEIVGKELRSTNKEFQQEIDDNIKEFFERTMIKPCQITSTTVDGRVRELENLILQRS